VSGGSSILSTINCGQSSAKLGDPATAATACSRPPVFDLASSFATRRLAHFPFFHEHFPPV
jgi:hypothetical protein